MIVKSPFEALVSPARVPRVSAGVPGQGAGPLLAGGHGHQGGHLRHQDQPGLAGETETD